MAKTAAPTLFELAQAEAHRQHRLRMEQLERARATLAELEKDAEALSAASINLDLTGNYLWDYAEKACRISAGHVFAQQKNAELLSTLMARGWVLVDRINITPTWSCARIKRGRYRLILVDLPAVSEEQPQATAQPGSEATPA